MKISKEEAENVMTMLLSTDQENATIGFAAIEAFKFSSDNVGYLIYFYKFSKYTIDQWKTNAPKATAVLKKHINIERPLTYARAIQIMIDLKTSKDAIELTLNRHVGELTRMLDSMGYPTDKMVIDIKLKEQ